jgi:hypothetical protein
MADLTDEQLRALRLLARYPSGCPGTVLLEQGFSYDQLSDLVLDGLASQVAAERQSRRRSRLGGDHRGGGGRPYPSEKPPSR